MTAEAIVADFPELTVGHLAAALASGSPGVDEQVGDDEGHEPDFGPERRRAQAARKPGLTWAFVLRAGEENRTPVFSLGS